MKNYVGLLMGFQWFVDELGDCNCKLFLRLKFNGLDDLRIILRLFI